MRRAGFRLSAAVAAVALAAGVALGQSDRRGMMMISDGTNQWALSYAEPDIDLIVQPYVNRSDVATFVSQLDLSDAQQAAVQRLIDAYLEDFRTLLADKHPQPERAEGMNAMRGGGGDEADVRAGGPDDEDAGDRARDPEMNAMQSILLEELKADGIVKESLDELPVEPEFGIGVSMFRPDENGVQPPPEVSVSIGFGSEDDRLDEALRSKLEKAAERAVPRIADAVREQVVADHLEGVQQSPSEQIESKWNELQALRERIAEFRKAHEALLTKLFANAKRLLSAEQLEHWPAFERALRRIKTLPWGQLDGESTDLIALVEDLELTNAQQAALAEALTNYERQLDAALKHRNDILDTADQEIDVALYTGDYDEAMSTAERLARARVAVRDLNDRTIETLAPALEGRAAKALRSAALAESYPTIYRRTIGQRAFEDVVLMDELDGELQVAVLELADRHGQLVSEVNDRLYRSVRREQEEQLTRSVERGVAALQGNDDLPQAYDEQSAIAQAFQQRQDIDARYMKMLYDMLPAETVAKLPAIPKHDVGERVRAEHREGGRVEFEN